MTYQPVLPSGGNLGWTFLKSTRPDQQQVFNDTTSIRDATHYFHEHISSLNDPADLVNDHRMLKVALGAFGLDDDINNKFFIEKVLREGTTNEASFANRLSDKRYFALAQSFGFDEEPPLFLQSGFPEFVTEKYTNRQFEIAVGAQDENLRLALSVSRDLDSIAKETSDEEVAWFSIMGNPPLRRVFEAALGLPKEFAAIDLDQQLGVFQTKLADQFGTSDPLSLMDASSQEKLIRKFLTQAEAQALSNSGSGAAVALTLLQAAPSQI